ncbi:hypothetical protein BUL40_03520 [Croceivirga radicis]|uniref:Uncharacterized protein n=1 Tax=Croceivirga radicis TaxID=1929488 RepID=A0A1V6LU37_9FLAO|nr:hypothetical protein [Croceivirga radicis]OQD43691.1 hypothetical protein BUL40_03520 [Croceivirga radicis]
MECPNGIGILEKAIEKNWYTDVVRQLQKDFMLANINIHLDVDLLPEKLSAVLQEKIYVLLMEKYAKFLNLMYVMDIPESELINTKWENVVETSKQTTNLIINRIFNKVAVRKKFAT